MNDAIIPFLLHVKDTNNIPIYTPLDSAFLKQHQLSTTATTEALEKIEDTLKKEWYENFINTLALVVTLWIFIKQYRSDAKDRIRNTNQNWYMNVIIQPNLPEINGYYEELMRLFMKHIGFLKNNQHENQTLAKAKAVKHLKSVSKGFIDYFVTILQSYDVSLADKVEGVLDDMQDKLSEWVDDYSGIDIDDCKRVIYENKSELINALYGCITKEQSSLCNRLCFLFNRLIKKKK